MHDERTYEFAEKLVAILVDAECIDSSDEHALYVRGVIQIALEEGKLTFPE